MSKIRTPAWQRVVAELSAESPSDELFLARLTAVLGQVSGARQATLWSVPGAGGSADAGGGEAEAAPRPLMVWPRTPASAAPAAQLDVESAKETASAARSAVEGEQVRVYGLDGKDDPFYGGAGGAGQKGYVIATPAPVAPEGAGAGLGARPAITLLVES